MNFIKYAILLFLIAALWACKKKEYPDSVIVNDAEYYTTMTADGAPVVLQAGIDNYYMYTSYNKDSNSVYNLNSEFKKINCTNCPLSLRIQFTSPEASLQNEPIDIDSALQIKRYDFLSSNQRAEYRISFLSAYNRTAQAQNYYWTFGDGSEYYGTDPTHTYMHAGTYQVCLKVTGSNSCVSSVCNRIKIGNKSLLASIVALSTNDSIISFTQITSGGNPPYKYFWNFGDGTTETTANPSHWYKIAGAYPVSLRVSDALGDTTVTNYNAVTRTDKSSCAANFRVNSIDSTLNIKQNLSKVLISWTDSQGIVFRSNDGDQNSNSFFEVVSIEEGMLNEKNERTKKVRVKFSCLVYNGARTITLNNANAVIAIPYN